ncbi:MoxR-like ATPase [Halanaerobium saccharolyticum]|uniref:MoxR-like ATPase n=1 Tax=Halanaerobium saccharolyticum TaxID=43595 RepID=A0A4R7YY44_9FIRM|nr:MoxR family ATPase [Halanaerobium saccharolyticum]RAK12744.1 MoxR-like ATPase [Halanaerobium saccharolyticum]TDW02957.1 MoxR-like ATPase [Halanaerobium saccharolyticum]TDX62859.1 MoxR-like ATPase [Halanaerobium saccharolyticum]
MQNIEKVQKIIDNVEEVILGKNRVIKLALAAMMAEGHILFEDVPGVGKTILVRSLAQSIGCSFKRVQFTPDLLPSDITGVSIYNQKNNEFEFREGPILSQVVLADEINRATPRTQSALLESMAEKQITVEGISRRLADPFIVMATQNPIEYDGTFPLPEAQLDRFLIRLEIGYPESVDEQQILENLQLQHPVETLEAVMTDQEFIELQDDVKKVHVDQKLRKYIVELVNQSRNHSDLELGASPRGSIALMKMAQAWAVVNERDYIIPDDIKEIAPAVLAHRLIIKSKSRLRGADKEKIIDEIVRRTEVPVID